jgi:hypothetical protein
MKFNQAAFDMIKPMPPFIYPMREANRAGRKSQTRRVVDKSLYAFLEENERINGHIDMDALFRETNSPYGHRTDLRYMREPLFKGEDGFAYYKDDLYVPIRQEDGYPRPITNTVGAPVFHLITGEKIPWVWKVKTLSGMYMPKYAARLFRRYEFIRIERLQDISKADCIAEGILRLENVHSGYHQGYAALWDSLNAKRGYPWENNDWVWVIGYREDPAIQQAQWSVNANVFNS